MPQVDETIDTFRRGAFDIDCKRMVLAQHKEGGECFEGQGYIRQAGNGALIFKIYVAKHNAQPFGHLATFSRDIGRPLGDEAFYDLEAMGHDGIRWTATRILLEPNWNISDMTVLVRGEMQSVIAHLNMPQRHYYLRLHFFEEYEVPLLKMTEIEKNGNRHYVMDCAEFEACGAKFEVRQRKGSGDTTLELTSEAPLPAAFDLRIQEAFQYLTAKPAFWRARLQSHDNELRLELSSPRKKSAHTQFRPPILPISSDFREHGWRLFGAYLSYVTEKTRDTHWNPVAYHVYNACEAAANSVDAFAVGISVAVEAVTGLIAINDDDDNAEELSRYQTRACEWLAAQRDLSADIVKRATGQIKSMGNRRPQDTLYRLAKAGRVEKNYVRAWTNLRNRHVHPSLQNLRKPSPVDMQNLLDNLRQVEVLLKQLTFHLIDYAGPFTDYGVPNFPSKQYPLPVEN